MKFTEVFSKSYNEYVKNFRAILLLTLFFVGIPILLGWIGSLAFGIDFYGIDEDNFVFSPGLIGFGFILAVVGLVLYFIYEAGLFKESLKSKFSFYSVFESGKHNFWRFVWYCIVAFIFLGFLFLLLVIPGIIFSIYWILSVYIYLENPKMNVRQALRKSREMVSGNWWRLFGYTIIIFLLSAIIEGTLTSFGHAGYGSLRDLGSFISTLIVFPFVVLFYKNVYLDLKKGGVKEKKVKKKKK